MIPSLPFCLCGNHYPKFCIPYYPTFLNIFFLKILLSLNNTLLVVMFFEFMYLFIYHIEYIGQYFAPEIHLCSFFHSSDSFIPPALRYKSMAMQLNILLLMSIWVVSSLSLHSSRNGYGDCCISAVVLISLAVA